MESFNKLTIKDINVSVSGDEFKLDSNITLDSTEKRLTFKFFYAGDNATKNTVSLPNSPKLSVLKSLRIISDTEIELHGEIVARGHARTGKVVVANKDLVEKLKSFSATVSPSKAETTVSSTSSAIPLYDDVDIKTDKGGSEILIQGQDFILGDKVESEEGITKLYLGIKGKYSTIDLSELSVKKIISFKIISDDAISFLYNDGGKNKRVNFRGAGNIVRKLIEVAKENEVTLTIPAAPVAPAAVEPAPAPAPAPVTPEPPAAPAPASVTPASATLSTSPAVETVGSSKTKIITEQFAEYDSKLNLPISEIYVTAGSKYYAIEDLYIYNLDASKVRKVTSFEEYLKYQKLGQITISKTAKVEPDAKLYSANYTIPAIHTVADESTGYLKHVKLIANSFDFDADKYVLVKFAGERSPRLIMLGDISYYESSEEKKVIKKEDLLKELYSKGKRIELIYAKHCFVAKQLEFKLADGTKVDAVSESFDAATKKLTKYSIVYEGGSPKVDADGSIIVETTEVSAKSHFAIKTYTEKTVDAEDGKSEAVVLAETKKYVYDEHGEYVQVTLTGGEGEHVVKISDLKTTSGEAVTTLTAGTEYVLNIDGEGYRTKPLTTEQVLMRFKPEAHFTKALADEAMSDRSYLKLKSGLYVKEDEIAKPKYFKKVGIIGDTVDFDAYLVTITKDGNTESFVVDKKLIEGKTFPIKIKGNSVVAADVQKIKRVESFSACEVVQTTSSAESKGVENCQVFANKKERNEAKTQIHENFRAAYASRKYQLESAFVNGKLEDLDPTAERYVYSETSYHASPASKTAEYKALSPKPFYYEIDENGNLSDVKGGPEYSWSKGVGEDMKIVGKLAGYGLASMFSAAGLLVAVAAPALLTVAGGALAVAPVAIMAKHAVRKYQNSWVRNKKKWQDFDKTDEHKWQDEFKKILTTSQTKAKEETLDVNQFATLCNTIDDKIVALQAINNTQIAQSGGKIEVNSHNIYSVRAFVETSEEERAIINGKLTRRQTKKLLKEREKLMSKAVRSDKEEERLKLLETIEDNSKVKEILKKKEGARTPEEIEILDRHQTQQENFKNKMLTTRREGLTIQPDEKSLVLSANAEKFKAFMYLKHIYSTLEESEKAEIGLDSTVIDAFKLLDFDVEKGVLLFKSKPLTAKNIAKVTGLHLSALEAAMENEKVLAKISSIEVGVEIEEEYSSAQDDAVIELENELMETKARCLALVEEISAKIDEIKGKDYYAAHPYVIIESVNLDHLKDLANIGVEDFSISKEDLETAKIELGNAETILTNTRNDVNETALTIEEVETSIVASFNAKMAETERLMALPTFAALKPAIKREFTTDVDNSKGVFNAVLGDGIRSESDFANIQTNKQTLKEVEKGCGDKLIELQGLLIDVEKSAMSSFITGRLSDAYADILDAEATDVGTSISAYIEALNSKKSTIEGILAVINNADTPVAQAKQLKDKALEYLLIIKMGTETIKLISGKKIADALALGYRDEIFTIMETISEQDPIEIDKPSFKDVQSVRKKVEKKFQELRAQLVKVTRATSTATARTKFSASDVVTESTLIEKLKDKTSTVYTAVLAHLQTTHGKTASWADKKIEEFIKEGEAQLSSGELIEGLYRKGTIKRGILDVGCPMVGKSIAGTI